MLWPSEGSLDSFTRSGSTKDRLGNVSLRNTACIVNPA